MHELWPSVVRELFCDVPGGHAWHDIVP
jgi:hypothetical protein